MRKRCRRHGLMVAMVTCLVMAVALGGCGSVAEHPTSGGGTKHTPSARLAMATVSNSSEVAACMQRNGVTVLSNSGLQTAKAVTTAKRKAVERRCGFGVPKGGRRSQRPATRAASKPLAVKLVAKASSSSHSRLVAKIAACLHHAGINIPNSDAALLSSTSGIRTRSPRVKAAIGKCRSEP
jgi:uncharacterized protein YceK